MKINFDKTRYMCRERKESLRGKQKKIENVREHYMEFYGARKTNKNIYNSIL